ncbi:putative RNA-directed DNA polymerase from transposon BS-like Protein [Tribolium castaneum]|uniref:Putative RNA-directed DNA polymerase from transposon BS-like Protein n=1 Tax=Tribolium castaneum TaxID=7070 RepID=A0A139W9R5_TRICA|nr:putative RNA-directed DNA polymerase from transposon BS-like Protein [Tribolium castaneum]
MKGTTSILAIYTEEIQQLTDALSKKKAPGQDRISNRMINAILKLRSFPKRWKTSQIIMLPKPGKPRTDPNSYRPISLLSALSKTTEKIIYRLIYEHIIKNSTIQDEQFGFRKKHNATHQVSRLTENIKRLVSKRVSPELPESHLVRLTAGLVTPQLAAASGTVVPQSMSEFVKAMVQVEDNLKHLRSNQS